MLVTRGDPRWDGYIACGREYHGLSELYRELPKDIIICDWQYDYPQKDGKEPQVGRLEFSSRTMVLK